MMFEDPEEYDEKIIAENEQEIPYTDENEIDEIVNDIVSELRAFWLFPHSSYDIYGRIPRSHRGKWLGSR